MYGSDIERTLLSLGAMMMVNVLVRFTPSQLSVLRASAKRNGLSLAAMLRLLVSERFMDEIATVERKKGKKR